MPAGKRVMGARESSFQRALVSTQEAESIEPHHHVPAEYTLRRDGYGPPQGQRYAMCRREFIRDLPTPGTATGDQYPFTGDLGRVAVCGGG